MKSSNIQRSIAINFAQSTVSSNRPNQGSSNQRKVMTPVVAKRQFDHSKSYVFENSRYKKEDSGLRKTINYDQPLTPTPNRPKLQDFLFLRNTSSYSISDDKQFPNNKKHQISQSIKPKYQKDSWSTNNNSFVENKSNNVQKILQKIQKKQRLINQLKQLTKFNVAEQVKNNMNDNSKNNQKVGNNRSVRNSAEFKTDIYQPRKNTLEIQQFLNMNKTNFDINIVKEEKIQAKPVNKIYNQKTYYKITERLTANNLTVKNKNPQEQLAKQADLKKAKNSYLTPKQIKSYNADQKSYSNLFLSKKQLLPQKQQKTAQQLYRSCRYNFETIDSKVSVSRKQQSRTIQDIRQMSDVRLIKNNVNYFTNKKISIYDFEILKPLGQGKFGSVIQAIHKTTNSIFAIKKISKKVINSNMMIDQLLKEIKIQSFCQNENILNLYGVFDDLDNVYLILEYMEEGTLFTQLKKHRNFTEKQASIKLRHVAKAIVYLHDNGIAHRDIKPQNIVMSNGVGKLCDFGWATFCGKDRRKTYCGTFDYAAPEILQGSQYDITVDLWCLGVLAYQLLVGKAPFYHYSRKQTMKKILNVENQSVTYPSNLSKEAISFIDSLIRKNPQQRMNGNNILNHPFILNAQKLQL